MILPTGKLTVTETLQLGFYSITNRLFLEFLGAREDLSLYFDARLSPDHEPRQVFKEHL
jgi:hypothetical protein